MFEKLIQPFIKWYDICSLSLLFLFWGTIIFKRHIWITMEPNDVITAPKIIVHTYVQLWITIEIVYIFAWNGYKLQLLYIMTVFVNTTSNQRNFCRRMQKAECLAVKISLWVQMTDFPMWHKVHQFLLFTLSFFYSDMLNHREKMMVFIQPLAFRQL